MLVVCQWCRKTVDMPDGHQRSKPFLIDRVAHRGPRRNPICVEPVPEQPPLTWRQISERARQFWSKEERI